MNKKYYYQGTLFEFFNSNAYIPAIEKYILAESHEDGYSFQLICISGYDAGSLSGYIKEEQLAVEENKIAVSKEHFIKEIERNFGKIDIKTLKFIASV